MVPTIEWKNGRVRMLDQRLLPQKAIYVECSDYQEVARAITSLLIRGAPAIGIAAAMGVALGAQGISTADVEEFCKKLSLICEEMGETRPTAVNLFWALSRMKACALRHRADGVAQIKAELIRESQKILEEDIASNRAIGRHGAAFISHNQTILTHCNAGSLATGGYGTALGIIRTAWEEGKKITVVATETRPVLQGARLTTWELMQDGIPVTLIPDAAAGFLMKKGKIDLCIVGADRIAACGDVANKIGTYSLALLAREHGIPFLVAAPSSSIDPSLPSGDFIPIEERSPHEVSQVLGRISIAPEGIPILNYAFDVTPASLIQAIITEKGAFRPEDLKKLWA